MVINTMQGALGGLLLLFASTAILTSSALATDKPGFVEGHINVAPLTSVLRQGAPAPVVSAEAYAALQLAIFKADGKTKVADLTPDSKGNFHQALPPGTYVIGMTPSRMTKANLPQTITIVSDQTVRVNVDIDTGIR